MGLEISGAGPFRPQPCAPVDDPLASSKLNPKGQQPPTNMTPGPIQQQPLDPQTIKAIVDATRNITGAEPVLIIENSASKEPQPGDLFMPPKVEEF